jgi:hypothetical protein
LTFSDEPCYYLYIEVRDTQTDTTKMTITIKKEAKREYSGGDHGSVGYGPAAYGIYLNDELVGIIRGTRSSYRNNSVWAVCTGSQWRPLNEWLRTLKDAKAWATSHSDQLVSTPRPPIWDM